MTTFWKKGQYVKLQIAYTIQNNHKLGEKQNEIVVSIYQNMYIVI